MILTRNSETRDLPEKIFYPKREIEVYMRIVLVLLIVALAVSGCASSGVTMYSMPTESKVCMRSQDMHVNAQPLAFDQTVDKKQAVKDHSSKQNKTNKPKQKKKSKKNNFLNNAMGVSVKLIKGAIKEIKPRLSRL